MHHNEKSYPTASACRRNGSWLSGIPYEVAFWRSYYGNRRRRMDLFQWSQYNQECVLDNFDVTEYLTSTDCDKPIIVDVGCALSYAFGNIFGGVPRDVVYMDPLAPFYNDILDDYNIDRPRICFGMGEALSAFFQPDTVNLVHIRNALDHSAEPLTAIVQALIVLKPGGVLYLNHKPDEAEHENYRGFHQHNITCREGRLVIWNKEKTIDVGEIIDGFAEVETNITAEGRIVAVIRKTGPVSEDALSSYGGVDFCSEMLMSVMAYLHSAPRSLDYQTRRLVSTAGHRLMRLLPYGLINRIKRLTASRKSPRK